MTSIQPLLSEATLIRLSEYFKTTPENVFAAVFEAANAEKWSHLEKVYADLHGLYNQFGRTLLLEALQQGHLTLSKELIKREISIHTTDLHNNTPFHYIARMGDLDAADLIWHHISINARNHSGQTPLHIATESHSYQIIASLLANNASIDLCADYQVGQTLLTKVSPLHMAVIQGDQRSVDIMLRHHPNLMLQLPKVGHLLHIAIHFHNISMFKHLLTTHYHDFKKFIDLPNKAGQTPLMLAAYLGEGEAIFFLKEKQATLEKEDLCGQTAVHWAVRGEQKHALTLLASFGCHLDKLDLDNKRPADFSQDRSLVAYLYNLIRQEDKLDKTPALFALEPVENIVLKGGGPKGIVHVGAVYALEQVDVMQTLRRCAGTSAGAIQAALLAVGYSAREMEKILKDLDLTSLLDHKLAKKALAELGCDNAKQQLITNLMSLYERILEAFPKFKSLASADTSQLRILKPHTTSGKIGSALKSLIPGKTLYDVSKDADDIKAMIAPVKETAETIYQSIQGQFGNLTDILKELMHQPGLCDGQVFFDLIESLIYKKTQIKHCTFGELVELIEKGKPFKHLYVYVTLLGAARPVCVNSEGIKWKNVLLADAVRASMSIPGVFKPYSIRIKKEGRLLPHPELIDCVDGGMLRNFPIDAFDKRRFLPTSPKGEEGAFHVINKRTLGLKIVDPDHHLPQPLKMIRTLPALLASIINLYCKAEDLFEKQVYENQFRIINISNLGVSLMSFTLHQKQQNDLIASGKGSVIKFFEKREQLASRQESLFIRANLIKTAQGLFLPQSLSTFSGRKKYLLNLRKRLARPDKLPIVVLHGIPGIGKTELAIAFANQTTDKYGLIWIIYADTPERQLTSYRSLAEHLSVYVDNSASLTHITNRVHHALATMANQVGRAHKPFLLIYDNYDHTDIPLSLPQRGNGVIIITSRSKLPIGQLMEVKPFTNKEVVSYLTKILKTQDTSNLKRLGKRLGGSPLALTQAANYLKETPEITLVNYLKELSSKPMLALLEQADRNQKPLLQTWSPLFTKLKILNPSSLEFLKIAAYLHPDNIPLDWIGIFLSTTQHNPNTRFIKQHKLRQVLQNYSLLLPHASGYFSVHRLQQEVLLEQLSLQERKLAKHAALQLLATAAKNLDPKDPTHWPSLVNLEPHAFYCLSHNTKENPSEMAAALYFLLGYWMGTQGRDLQALEYKEKSYSIRLALYGDTLHPKIADSLESLGISYSGLGDDKKAFDYKNRAYQMRLSLYGNKPHQDIAQSLYGLGISYGCVANNKKALEYFEQAYQMRLTLYGNKPHPKIAHSLHSLGVSYGYLQNNNKALEYFQKAYQMRLVLYGETLHPDIARSMRSLGSSYSRTGDNKKAIEYKTRAYQMRLKLYSNKPHPDIARSMHSLAGSYARMGDHEKALEYFEQAYQMRLKLYDNECHPEIAQNLHSLGVIYGFLKDKKKALEYFEKTYQIRVKLYNDQPHPEITQSLHTLDGSCCLTTRELEYCDREH